VIKECVNNTTCIETYADVYSALASPKNYFNIALALYPARKPSSVLVHVNLHTFNQTGKSSPVPYTWSMSCLYAALPARVLELLSLGSILVTSRKRELNITIAPFCCNVSEDDRFMMIDRVLAELQDLAVRPAIQDPTLNTAECVIEGHKTNISAIPAEHRAYIRAMLWCSFVFTILFGPTLATITFALFHTENNNDNNDKTKNKRKDDSTEDKRPENKSKRQMLAKAVKVVSCVLSIGKSTLLFTTIGFLKSGNTLCDLYVILPLIFLEVLVLVPASIFAGKKYQFFPGNTSIELVAKVGIFLWTNLTIYYFCWLVIGIMINPLWGITVLLVISIVIVVTVFLVFIVLHSDFDPMNSVLCIFGWFSTVLLVTLLILAGQSFFIRETANEVVKAALLYFTTALIAWIISKVIGEKSEKSKKTDGEETVINVPPVPPSTSSDENKQELEELELLPKARGYSR